MVWEKWHVWLQECCYRGGGSETSCKVCGRKWEEEVVTQKEAEGVQKVVGWMVKQVGEGLEKQRREKGQTGLN